MNIISIDGKTFKQYKDTKYYIDIDGNIYSGCSKKMINPMIRGKQNKRYPYIDINFGSGQKHCYVHKLVYETWIGEIPTGKLVLHKDDNQFNNNVNNLYLGNQKDNIRDCNDNQHGVGNLWLLTVHDNYTGDTMTFCPASDITVYANHPCKNGNVNRLFSRNWFKKRFIVIDYRRCLSIEEKEGVTTMADECKPVE